MSPFRPDRTTFLEILACAHRDLPLYNLLRFATRRQRQSRIDRDFFGGWNDQRIYSLLLLLLLLVFVFALACEMDGRAVEGCGALGKCYD
jgi:hypothetical protein